MNKRYIDFVPAKKKAEDGAVVGAVAGTTKKAVAVKPVEAVERPAKVVDPVRPVAKRAMKTSARMKKPVEPERAERLERVEKPERAEKAKKVEKPEKIEEPEETEEEMEMEELSMEDFQVEEVFAERKKPAGVSEGLKYGVIEDFNPHFVKTEVEKRPLNEKKEKEVKKVEEAEEIRTTKQGGIPERTRVEETEEVEEASEDADKDKRVQRAAFAVNRKPRTAAMAKKIERRPTTPFVNTDRVEKRPLSRNVYQKQVVVPKEEPSGPVTIIQKPEKDSRVGLIVAIIITIILGATAGTVAFLLLPK